MMMIMNHDDDDDDHHHHDEHDDNDDNDDAKRGAAQSNQSSPGFCGPLCPCSTWSRATQKPPASMVPSCRQTSADWYGGVPSPAPATRNDADLVQVLHTRRR